MLYAKILNSFDNEYGAREYIRIGHSKGDFFEDIIDIFQIDGEIDITNWDPEFE